MVFKNLTVTCKEGIHARTAAHLASICMNCESKVEMRIGQNTLNPTNIYELMARPIKYGTEVEILCNGLTEEEDLAKITAFFEGGMVID